jgi:hypothetical protein
MRRVLLSKAQLDAWSSFGSRWDAFKEAWLERGFFWPPEGDPRDDADTSLRSRLWKIAEARPDDLGQWVSEAPGRSAHEVIGYVFRQFNGFREEIGADDWDTFDAEKMGTRYIEQMQAHTAWTRIGKIVRTLPFGNES